MADISISLDRYVSLSMGTVEGYLTPLDARLIAALLTYQNQNRIRGHLCEIGVHHGRLFLMLAMARRFGERALGIDLFEDDAINIGCRQAGRDQALFVNARRLGIRFSKEETFMTSSLDIGPAAILARTTGPIRFWSIDGGHLYRHVENDLLLAEATVAPMGVIAVDDFFNPRWPEVSLAAYDFLQKTDSIVPFAITRGKIYLTDSGAAEIYKAALRLHTEMGHQETVQILGKDVLLLKQGRFSKECDIFRYTLVREASRLASMLRRQ
jgi:hypothetical protein